MREWGTVFESLARLATFEHSKIWMVIGALTAQVCFFLPPVPLSLSPAGIWHLIIHEYLNWYEMTFTPVGIHCRSAAICLQYIFQFNMEKPSVKITAFAGVQHRIDDNTSNAHGKCTFRKYTYFHFLYETL